MRILFFFSLLPFPCLTAQAVEWAYMKEAPYVWSVGRTSWSVIYTTPRQELWAYHWDSEESEMIYREATPIPASLDWSRMYFTPSDESVPGGWIWFFEGGLAKTNNLPEVTYAYYWDGKSDGAKVSYFVNLIFSGLESQTVIVDIELTWTSPTGGTYARSGVSTYKGELLSSEDSGTFEWIP